MCHSGVSRFVFAWHLFLTPTRRLAAEVSALLPAGAMQTTSVSMDPRLRSSVSGALTVNLGSADEPDSAATVAALAKANAVHQNGDGRAGRVISAADRERAAQVQAVEAAAQAAAEADEQVYDMHLKSVDHLDSSKPEIEC